MNAKKLCVALLSGLGGLGVGWGLFVEPEPEEVVEFVTLDNLDSILAERAEHLRQRGPDAGADSLGRIPIPEEVAVELFASLSLGFTVYDPQAYFMREPNLRKKQRFADHPKGGWMLETNSIGLRDDELLEGEPAFRVLVTGDSHTEGACATHENFANQLEALLRRELGSQRIEVLNAGKGGYGFWNYLGVVEKFLYLKPDAIVVAAFGGNDFLDALALEHYFGGTERPAGGPGHRKAARAALEVSKGATAQGFQQLSYFQRQPGEAPLSLEAVDRVTAALEDLCEREEVPLTFVYIPPMMDVQPEQNRELIDAMVEAMRLEPGSLTITDRLADRWIELAAERGQEVLDLRPPFRADPEDLYWDLDQHINVLAHQRIAELLLPRMLEIAKAKARPGSRRAQRSD